MKKLCVVVVAFMMATIANAKWADAFDEEPTDSGPPDNYEFFGALARDSGVTGTLSQSSPNSAFVAVELGNLAFNFAAVLLRDELTAPISLPPATRLSADIRSDVDLSGSAGHVAFHLYDADGSQWRTGNADLYAPGLSFATFAHRVSALTVQVAVGTEPGLDTENIVQYGIDFYEQSGGVTGTTTFYVDNIASIIPEPSVAALLICGCVVLVGRRKLLLHHRTAWERSERKFM